MENGKTLRGSAWLLSEIRTVRSRAARGKRHGQCSALILRLAFEYGLRFSELVELRWSAVGLMTR
ncbi:hypothetical protein RAN53_13885 [Halomonas sp. SSL-5]|uniref:hypothetical protein n=1 Tax=Halomonas sp. SSL-5 TaxID=3065855 RepID=UPI002738CDC8|nr:hypothetical protein [Halomonas sp. SSL-5]MDY7117440.1 hypothetical protein [Halomonas sp. SSL-5]